MPHNNDEIINEEDARILLGECDFSDSYFNLDETIIPIISKDQNNPITLINNDLNGFKDNITIAHINARSVTKHIVEIERVLQLTQFDVLGVSETFIKSNTPSNLYQINGYTFFHKDRTAKCGGGIGLYVRNHIKAKTIKLTEEINQPEIFFVELSINHSKMAVGVLYKPPKIPYGVFGLLHETLAYITTKYQHTIIVGDFNTNYLIPNSLPVNFLQVNVAEPFGLTQIIKKQNKNNFKYK